MADNFFGVTNTGRIRDNNEDTFIAETLPNGWIVACVIDGVGGYEGGEVAAEIARTTVQRYLQQLAPDPLQSLRDSLLQANLTIYNEKLQLQGKDQMACVVTLVVVDMENNQFYYAHVGDTRLYLLRDHSLVKVTKDHSFVGFLEDSGRLSEKEAMAHPKRNEINKALGFDPQIDLKEDYIETGSSPFLPGDMLLLCSDGLSDLVNRSEMTAILLSSRTLAQKTEALVDAANVAGGKDNITVVLVHNNKKPQKTKATKPAASKKNESFREPPVAGQIPPLVKRERQPVQAKTKPVLVWSLAILSLLLAVACWWLWSNNKETADPLVKETAAYVPNEKEKRLADSLGLAPRSFSISGTDPGWAIILGDTLFVRQDTMRITGNGVVLQSDTAYSGPAFVITANNKALVLENITFRNFATAIVLQGRGLQLKNVRFENCAQPVQQVIYLPSDSSLNGSIHDAFQSTQNRYPNNRSNGLTNPE